MYRPNLLIPNLIYRLSSRRGFPVVLLVLAFFALPEVVLAVTPPPDGGYPGGNTAEGDGALANVQISNVTGTDNTAVGFQALNPI